MVWQLVLGVGAAIALAVGFGVPLLTLAIFPFVHPVLSTIMVVGIIGLVYLFKK